MAQLFTSCIVYTLPYPANFVKSLNGTPYWRIRCSFCVICYLSFYIVCITILDDFGFIGVADTKNKMPTFAF